MFALFPARLWNLFNGLRLRRRLLDPWLINPWLLNPGLIAALAARLLRDRLLFGLLWWSRSFRNGRILLRAWSAILARHQFAPVGAQHLLGFRQIVAGSASEQFDPFAQFAIVQLGRWPGINAANLYLHQIVEIGRHPV